MTLYLQIAASGVTYISKSIDASDIAFQCIFGHLSIHRAKEHSRLEILQYNMMLVDILLDGDIAIQHVGGWRYCNTIYCCTHIYIAINILMAVDIAIQYIARHRYCNKYICRSQNHQYNNNIIVHIPALN
jgi:hypothetical protein